MPEIAETLSYSASMDISDVESKLSTIEKRDAQVRARLSQPHTTKFQIDDSALRKAEAALAKIGLSSGPVEKKFKVSFDLEDAGKKIDDLFKSVRPIRVQLDLTDAKRQIGELHDQLRTVRVGPPGPAAPPHAPPHNGHRPPSGHVPWQQTRLGRAVLTASAIDLPIEGAVLGARKFGGMTAGGLYSAGLSGFEKAATWGFVHAPQIPSIASAAGRFVGGMTAGGMLGGVGGAVLGGIVSAGVHDYLRPRQKAGARPQPRGGRCPQCGAALPSGAGFCPRCGWGSGAGSNAPAQEEELPPAGFAGRAAHAAAAGAKAPFKAAASVGRAADRGLAFAEKWARGGYFVGGAIRNIAQATSYVAKYPFKAFWHVGQGMATGMGATARAVPNAAYHVANADMLGPQWDEEVEGARSQLKGLGIYTHKRQLRRDLKGAIAEHAMAEQAKAIVEGRKRKYGINIDGDRTAEEQARPAAAAGIAAGLAGSPRTPRTGGGSGGGSGIGRSLGALTASLDIATLAVRRFAGATGVAAGSKRPPGDQGGGGGTGERVPPGRPGVADDPQGVPARRMLGKRGRLRRGIGRGLDVDSDSGRMDPAGIGTPTPPAPTFGERVRGAIDAGAIERDRGDRHGPPGPLPPEAGGAAIPRPPRPPRPGNTGLDLDALIAGSYTPHGASLRPLTIGEQGEFPFAKWRKNVSLPVMGGRFVPPVRGGMALSGIAGMGSPEPMPTHDLIDIGLHHGAFTAEASTGATIATTGHGLGHTLGASAIPSGPAYIPQPPHEPDLVSIHTGRPLAPQHVEVRRREESEPLTIGSAFRRMMGPKGIAAFEHYRQTYVGPKNVLNVGNMPVRLLHPWALVAGQIRENVGLERYAPPPGPMGPAEAEGQPGIRRNIDAIVSRMSGHRQAQRALEDRRQASEEEISRLEAHTQEIVRKSQQATGGLFPPRRALDPNDTLGRRIAADHRQAVARERRLQSGHIFRQALTASLSEGLIGRAEEEHDEALGYGEGGKYFRPRRRAGSRAGTSENAIPLMVRPSEPAAAKIPGIPLVVAESDLDRALKANRDKGKLFGGFQDVSAASAGGMGSFLIPGAESDVSKYGRRSTLREALKAAFGGIGSHGPEQSAGLQSPEGGMSYLSQQGVSGSHAEATRRVVAAEQLFKNPAMQAAYDAAHASTRSASAVPVAEEMGRAGRSFVESLKSGSKAVGGFAAALAGGVGRLFGRGGSGGGTPPPAGGAEGGDDEAGLPPRGSPTGRLMRHLERYGVSRTITRGSGMASAVRVGAGVGVGLAVMDQGANWNNRDNANVMASEEQQYRGKIGDYRAGLAQNREGLYAAGIGEGNGLARFVGSSPIGGALANIGGWITGDNAYIDRTMRDANRTQDKTDTLKGSMYMRRAMAASTQAMGNDDKYGRATDEITAQVQGIQDEGKQKIEELQQKLGSGSKEETAVRDEFARKAETVRRVGDQNVARMRTIDTGQFQHAFNAGSVMFTDARAAVQEGIHGQYTAGMNDRDQTTRDRAKALHDQAIQNEATGYGLQTYDMGTSNVVGGMMLGAHQQANQFMRYGSQRSELAARMTDIGFQRGQAVRGINAADPMQAERLKEINKGFDIQEQGVRSDQARSVEDEKYERYGRQVQTYAGGQRLIGNNLNAARQEAYGSYVQQRRENPEMAGEIDQQYRMDDLGIRKSDAERREGIALGTRSIQSSAEQQLDRNKAFFRTAEAKGIVSGTEDEIARANIDLQGDENKDLREKRVAALKQGATAKLAGITDIVKYGNRAETVSGLTNFGDQNNQAFKDFAAAQKVAANAPGDLDKAGKDSDVSAAAKGGTTAEQAERMIALLTQMATNGGW